MASEYKRLFKRDLEGYTSFLGANYALKHNSLKLGATIFDPGAGLVVAALEDVSKGLKAFAINAQDFWGELHNAPLSDAYDNVAVSIEELIYQFKISVEGIKNTE